MITWKDFQRLMPWEIVILVGGGYALAAGCKVVCVWLHVLAYFGTRGLKAGVFSGVRLVGVDRQTAGAHERSPSLGRHPAGLPAGLGGHRVCVQPGDSYRLPAHTISTGAAHTHRQILFTLLLIFIFSLSVQSESLHINPLHTLIPSTMCVSFGVMLPVGNPPNAIVFSYGHVQIKDMVRLTHTLFTCLKLLSVK